MHRNNINALNELHRTLNRVIQKAITLNESRFLKRLLLHGIGRRERRERERAKNDSIDGQNCRPDEQEGSVTSRDILSHTRRHHPIPQGLCSGYNVFEYKLDGP